MTADMCPSDIDFILEFLRSRRPDIGDVAEDTDLIKNRLITSLMFVEFLYRLEEQTGISIPLEEVIADDFRTIARIRARFFPREASGKVAHND